MWNVIRNNEDAVCFMKQMANFHDGCLKELTYYSGAYVDKDLAMYPINDKNVLRLIIQRQAEHYSMVELEFTGLLRLELIPVDILYTCEILNADLRMQNETIIWCDHRIDDDSYKDGIEVHATGLRWREIKNRMGESIFYRSVE